MSHSTVTAIVLRYEEPGWTDATLKCLLQSPYPIDVIVVDREGVGGLSAPFNAGAAQTKADYLWFLTNVRFGAQAIPRMVEVMNNNLDYAAIHPAFESDHAHLRPMQLRGDSAIIPFIEWTAPFVRRSVWEEIGGLDEQMPYWGMDLDWSHRAKLAGHYVGLCPSVTLDHLYLRHTVPVCAVTRDRQRIRAEHDKVTEQRLREKWGDDWLRDLWPSHPYVAEGRKVIYE